MKVAIIGIGQLGSMLSKVLSSHHEVYELPHSVVDITNYNLLNKKLSEINPDIVINTAAMVNVDSCENNPLNAFNINCIGQLNVSRVTNELDAVNIYISTDFVFDGNKRVPYIESDKPMPINVYGMSKFCGEFSTLQYSEKHYILRVASLFGSHPTKNKKIGNFVEFVLNNLTENREINVITDITMSPTYTKTVADIVLRLLDKMPEYGIYHTVNSGYTTWYDFARYIAKVIDADENLIKPVDSTFFKRPARRPKFSALSNEKVKKTLGMRIHSWREAVEDFIQKSKE